MPTVPTSLLVPSTSILVHLATMAATVAPHGPSISIKTAQCSRPRGRLQSSTSSYFSGPLSSPCSCIVTIAPSTPRKSEELRDIAPGAVMDPAQGRGEAPAVDDTTFKVMRTINCSTLDSVRSQQLCIYRTHIPELDEFPCALPVSCWSHLRIVSKYLSDLLIHFLFGKSFGHVPLLSAVSMIWRIQTSVRNEGKAL